MTRQVFFRHFRAFFGPIIESLAIYSTQYTVYSLQYTLYSIQYSVYSIPNTVHCADVPL